MTQKANGPCCEHEPSTVIGRASEENRQAPGAVLPRSADRGNHFEGMGRDFYIPPQTHADGGRRKKNADQLSFRALVDRLVDACEDRMREQWGSHRTGTNRTLRALLRHLIARIIQRDGRLVADQRIAATREQLAATLRCAERTVSRMRRGLQELGDLVVPVTLHQGELAYDGQPSTARAHVEWHLGPRLRALVEEALSRAQGRQVDPDNLSPEFRSSRGRPFRSSRWKSTFRSEARPAEDRNFEEEGRDGPEPAPRPSPPIQRDTPRRPTSIDPSAAGAIVRQHPELVPLADRVIRQHREIAEPRKGWWIGITPGERALVILAIAHEPGPERHVLAQCAEASRLALADSRRNGRETAALSYAFGAPDGHEPGHWLRERLARLRERKRDRERARENASESAFRQPPHDSSSATPRRNTSPPRRTQAQSRPVRMPAAWVADHLRDWGRKFA